METFDPSKVVITWNGIRVQGYAPGTFVQVEPSADLYTITVGAGGEAARSRNPDESAKITLTLMATSKVNDLMSAKVKLDKLGNIGWGPLLIKDLLGTTLVSAGRCWIERLPNIEYGQELGTRQWVLRCAEMSVVVGGNVAT